MSPDKITLTRTELYEKVWSTPMQRLAKDFGLSDVSLAKLRSCHKILCFSVTEGSQLRNHVFVGSKTYEFRVRKTRHLREGCS